MPGKKHIHSTDTKVLGRIYGTKRGWVFTKKDLTDLGSSSAVLHTLSRLAQKGTIHRIARGLYYYPQYHPKLGIIPPSPYEVAKALQSHDASRLMPTRAYAANLLGLSTQVPMKVVFLTDGRARKVKFGNQEVILKKATSRLMATADTKSGIVIQALAYLGKDNVADLVLNKIRSVLNQKEILDLRKHARYAPSWIGETMIRLSQAAEEEENHG